MKKTVLLLALCMQHIVAEKIVTLFVHGIADSGKQGLPFVKNGDAPYLVEEPFHTFNFACSTKHWWRIRMPKCSLGQEHELKQLNQQWEKLNAEYPDADGFILIGISRGASAIINFVATYKPQKIKALILESPFDSIDNVIKHKSEQLSIPIGIVKAAVRSIFWKYKPEGICPSKVINDIKDIPMLFITVENDHMVPHICTINLMNARKASGYHNCHHLHLMQGKHGHLMEGPDAQLYQDVAHAFFAQYGLPHNALCAERGIQTFAKST